MKSKKGAEMTVGTIIIIVLALIVLVVLVVGFTGGWGNLWTRITSFFGGANVDSIVQACQVACTTEAKYDYCDRLRSVKAESEVFCVDDTTKYMVGRVDAGCLANSTTTKASCNQLAANSSLGFVACPDLCTTA